MRVRKKVLNFGCDLHNKEIRFPKKGSLLTQFYFTEPYLIVIALFSTEKGFSRK